MFRNYSSKHFSCEVLVFELGKCKNALLLFLWYFYMHFSKKVRFISVGLLLKRSDIVVNVSKVVLYCQESQFLTFIVTKAFRNGHCNL